MARYPLATVGLLVALVATRAGAQIPSAVSLITLERTACFGTCPVYKVTLARDGAAVYEGIRWTPRIGRFHSSIDSLAFAQLAQLVLGQGFATLDSSYIEPVTDNPTTIVCLRWAATSRCVEHYGQVGPPNLYNIERAIDSTAVRLLWSGVSP